MSDLALAVVALLLDCGEQLCRCGFGSGGADQDLVDVVAALVDRGRDGREPGQEPGWVWLGEQGGHPRPVQHRHRLVVTADGGVEERLQDAVLEPNSRYTVAGGTPERLLMVSMVVAAYPRSRNRARAAVTTARRASRVRAIKAQDRHLGDAVAGSDDTHASALSEMKGRWKHPISGMGWYQHQAQLRGASRRMTSPRGTAGRAGTGLPASPGAAAGDDQAFARILA